MGFYIEKINIKNTDDSKNKLIELKKGLNLIYGGSNKGKSLIYQLINYVFGGEENFFNIPEMAGYQSVELQLSDGIKKYFLERSLVHKNPEIRFTEQGENIQLLKSSHDSHKEDNISYVMLKLSGLRFPAKARKNESGGTQVISFRNIIKFLMVSEDEIADTEEVLSFSNTDNTFYLNILKYLLSDRDDLHIQEVKNASEKKIAKVSFDNTIEILRELIENNYLDLQLEYKNGVKENSFEELGVKFQLVLEEQAELFKSEEAVKKSIAKEKRTLKKFNDLLEYYKERIEKLNFYGEGNELLHLLNILPCNACGEPFAIAPQQEAEEYEDTVSQEKMKLIIHQGEISKAIADVNQEILQLDKKLNEIQENIREIEDYQKQQILREIEQTLDMEKQIQKEEGLRNNINYFDYKIREIEKQKEDVSKSPTQKYKTEDDFTEIKNSELESIICKILNEWGMKTATLTIEKNNERKGRLEIYKDGKPRAAEGQGVRGIIHSAFNVALLQVLLKQSFSRPNFLVLDSPLKNWEGDASDLNEREREEISRKMLKDLTDNYKQAQIIIMENERSISNSLEDLRKRKEGLNLIEFKVGLL